MRHLRPRRRRAGCLRGGRPGCDTGRPRDPALVAASAAALARDVQVQLPDGLFQARADSEPRAAGAAPGPGASRQ